MGLTKLGRDLVPMSIEPIVAVSTDVQMYVTYIGSQASATVEVAAGGDMTFKHGASGSEAVDSGIGSSGVLDLSTPAAGRDTCGELVDEINRSSNWRAVLWSARRADLTDNTFITLSATQAKGTSVGLLGDTTVVRATNTYIIGQKVSRNKLLGNTDEGYRFGITSIEGIYTAAAQVAVINVYAVNDRAKTERLIWNNSTVLASATEFQFDTADWGYQDALYGKPGEALLVQVQVPNGANYTAPRLQIQAHAELVGVGAVPPFFKSDM